MTNEKVEEKVLVGPRRFVVKPRHGGRVRMRYEGCEDDAWIQHDVHWKRGEPYVARRMVQGFRSFKASPCKASDGKEERGGKDVVHGLHFGRVGSEKKLWSQFILCSKLYAYVEKAIEARCSKDYAFVKIS